MPSATLNYSMYNTGFLVYLAYTINTQIMLIKISLKENKNQELGLNDMHGFCLLINNKIFPLVISEKF